jgi:hypothetical protein
MRTRLAVAALAVGGAAALSTATNVPRLWAPFSLVSVLPNLIGGQLAMPLLADANHNVSVTSLQIVGSLSSVIFAAVLFTVWSRRLVGSAEIPHRSTIAFATVAVTNVVFLLASVPFGLRYQGLGHTTTVIAYNLAAALACLALYRRNRLSPSRSTNLAFHTMFFAALGFCAFPWLGELL